MYRKIRNRYKKVFKEFEPAELKEPANDNFIQQPSLPFEVANDNVKDSKEN